MTLSCVQRRNGADDDDSDPGVIQLDRLHLLTPATPDGQVAQRYALTPVHKTIFSALQLPSFSTSPPTSSPAGLNRRE